MDIKGVSPWLVGGPSRRPAHHTLEALRADPVAAEMAHALTAAASPPSAGVTTPTRDRESQPE